LSLAYLHSGTREEWDALAGGIIEADPQLRELAPSQRVQFIRLWARLGDRAALREAFAQNPDWEVESWRQRAEDFAAAGEYEAAYALLLKHLPAPRLPEMEAVPLRQAERAAALSPTSVVALYQALQAQRSAGDEPGALRTLRKLEALPTPPTYVWYLLGISHGNLGEWKVAWEALQKYQRSVPAAP
jgi:tetratricopeptide (TPR) repeat protein